VTDVRVDVTPVLDGEFQVDMSLVTTVGVCTLTESMGPAIAFTGGVVVGADASCFPCSPDTAPTCQLKSAWSTQRRGWCLRRQLRRGTALAEDNGMGGPVCVVVTDDDVLLGEGLASLLEGSGFDVVGRVGDERSCSN
jgi:hypothetical protein